MRCVWWVTLHGGDDMDYPLSASIDNRVKRLAVGESSVTPQRRTVVVFHGDVDGICAAGIIGFFECAEEYISAHPHRLGRALESVSAKVGRVVLVDLSVRRDNAEAIRKLKNLARRGVDVVVIDHHKSTMMASSLLASYGIRVHVSLRVASAAELALRVYGGRGSPHPEDVASIASAVEKGVCERLPRKLRREAWMLASVEGYGKAFPRIYGVAVRGIAEGRMPSKIPEVRRAHQEMLEVRRRFRERVLRSVIEVSERLYLWDVRGTFLGCVVMRGLIKEIIRSREGVVVCVLGKGDGLGRVVVVVRKNISVNVDLLEVCNDAARMCGGWIDGHKEAVSGVILEERIEDFLRIVGARIRGG